MPIDKFKLDTDLSQYVDCYIRFKKKQYNHISFKTEKIVSATKSELKTEKGTRVRITWKKTQFSNGSYHTIVGENDKYHPLEIEGIYKSEEMNQIVAESEKKIVRQYQTAFNRLRDQASMFNNKLDRLYSSVDFENSNALDQPEIKKLSFTEIVDLTTKIQQFLSKF
jgi:hypothetical protein